MIFGIGAAAKAAAEEIKHQRWFSNLEESCADAKRKYHEPLLDQLRGSRRYDAASALQGATLHLRMNAASREEDRTRLVDTYLNAMEQEYEMAKEDLNGEPATRGQLVALGLAMHEFSLSYPRDLASVEARLADQIAAGQAAHRSELASTVHALAGKLDSVAAAQRTQLKTAIQAVTEELDSVKRRYMRAVWIFGGLFALLAVLCGVLAFTLWKMGGLGVLSG